MCGDFVTDDAFANVVLVGETEMLLGGHVAEHCRAIPADLCRSNGARDVVIARSDVSDQRSQSVKRCFKAMPQLLIHIFSDALHGHVAGALYHHLYIVFPGPFCQLAEGPQFGKLRFIVGIVDRAWAKAIAKTEGDVVCLHNLADFVEMRVEEAFLVVRETPLSHDGSGARNDAGEPTDGEWNPRQTDTCVHGEVIYSLLRLLDERIAHQLPA